MRTNDVGASRLWRVAKAFTEVAENLVEDQTDLSSSVGGALGATAGERVGKRKRDPSRSAPIERDQLFDSAIEPNDLAFIRPLQQQPQPQHIGRTANDLASAGLMLDAQNNSGAALHDPDATAPAPTTAPRVLLDPHQPANFQEQMIQAANQGPLVFDWVLWDQCIDPDNILRFDLFDGNAAATGVEDGGVGVEGLGPAPGSGGGGGGEGGEDGDIEFF